MDVNVTRDEITHEKPGISIRVAGFKGSLSCAEPEQVYVEVHDGVLKVHVWDGTNEDPQTIVIQPETKCL